MDDTAHPSRAALSPRERRCEKIKTAHAKTLRRKGTQNRSHFFSLRPLRALPLCVKPYFVEVYDSDYRRKLQD
jgi:hypothetical protein